MTEKLKFADFRKLYKASLKSNDTEEWIDICFTRPIGLFFAIIWSKLGVRPNTITLVSIVLGAAAGFMFAHDGLLYNVWGVLLLMFANFCDSTDGQLARLTHQQSLLGRLLDGFSGDVWFFAIYIGIIFRLWNQPIPGLQMHWGIAIFALCAVAGILCHSPQASLADYYRQIHLFFLGHNSELAKSEDQFKQYEELKKNGGSWFQRLYFRNYAAYCLSQEKRTPMFQRFFKAYKANPDEAVKKQFIAGSRPIMKYTNWLTFNSRAIVIYITCLLGAPWVYPLFEIVVLSVLYINMHHNHEHLCKKLTEQL